MKNQLFLLLIVPFFFISIIGYSQGKGATYVLRTQLAGNALLPVPQQVSLTTDRYRLDDTWVISMTSNITKDDVAVTSLETELENRFGVRLKTGKTNLRNSIQLVLKSGSVTIGSSNDTNRVELERQAYRIKLTAGKILITANAVPGLFYAVQTLVQLLRSQNGVTYFSGGEITDWPDMNFRMIYWDDSHHLERLRAMKRAIRQASFYKINAFAVKLEGHFQFASAKPIVEPYAYTPEEYQELTDYANAHYVQLVPYIDAPAHLSFILKHPEYKSLRAFPNSNYELNVLDPNGDELLLGMFDNLLDANKGGKYVLLSTDEAYYVGKTAAEKIRAEQLGGNGKLLAEYITRISNKLHAKGRKVIIWAEYPLQINDIKNLPQHIINGVYSEKWAPKIKQHGMRQLIYTSIQGVEPLFPNYHKLPATFASAVNATVAITDDEAQQGDLSNGRVGEVLKGIQSAIAARNADLMGVVVAGWADAGLNPETFWLGYACGGAAGWNSKGGTAEDLSNRFYNSFYGSGTVEMGRLYQLLSTQAAFWEKSWDWQPSKWRTPILGNSYGIFDTPRLAKDQTLPLLPVPSITDPVFTNSWNLQNNERLQAAKRYLQENNELVKLLHENLLNVNFQHYNLQVLFSIAQLCRQNINMLLDLARINDLLVLASDMTTRDPAAAVSVIDHSLDVVNKMKDERDAVVQAVQYTWYQDWYPRVPEANGRKFIDQVDDIKDHQPIRTVDMSYLIYRQLKYPLGRWAEEVRKVRNGIASRNNLAQRSNTIAW